MNIPEYRFPTDYPSIMARLESIDPVRYEEDRNYLSGHVTLLSPYISRGLITLSDVRESVLRRGYRAHQIQSFLKELAWREYFIRVWEGLGTDRMLVDIRQDQEGVLSHDMPSAIYSANTGIEAIDKGINSLISTGYMHNHLRMYVAGIACNMSGAHWKTASQWMYYHLLDGDIASNTCSWQWNAGSFSSKKYIATQDNINKYTESKQKSTFLSRSYEDIWQTTVPDNLRIYQTLQMETKLPCSEELFLDREKPLCIYTNYWLNTQWKSDIDANRVLVLSPSHFHRFPVSDKVLDFVIQLARSNISGIRVFVGEIEALRHEFRSCSSQNIYLVDHILYSHIEGVTKTPYPYMVREVDAYCASFFAYWKKIESYMLR